MFSKTKMIIKSGNEKSHYKTKRDNFVEKSGFNNHG